MDSVAGSNLGDDRTAELAGGVQEQECIMCEAFGSIEWYSYSTFLECHRVGRIAAARRRATLLVDSVHDRGY